MSPTWRRPSESRVVVAVDLSASTRGATFRDRAALDRRVRELLGDTPFDVVAFADGAIRPLSVGSPLPDLPADRTHFIPPADAAAVVLLSDGRFDAPSSACPPIYAVIDAALDSPADAAIENVTRRGEEIDVVARGGNLPRAVAIDGGSTVALASGSSPQIVTLPGVSGREIVARVLPSDRWPENNALTRRADPPAGVARWFVDRAPLREGDRSIDPAALPLDDGEWLSASAVVLTRDAASRLPPAAARQIDRYVRALGGSLILIDDATVAAAPSAIDALLPLSLDPPTATRQWVLLVDASGSMAEATPGGGRRFDLAAAAVRSTLGVVPANDPVIVASFADSTRVWASADKPTAIDRAALPPRDVLPSGPTNLRAALESTASTTSHHPRQVVVMTDGDADLGNDAVLARTLNEAHIGVSFVLTGERSSAAIGRLAAATGGSVHRAGEPARWSDAMREMLASRRPAEPLSVDAAPDGEAPSPRVEKVRRVWEKSSANVLSTVAAIDQPKIPVAAHWRLGAGQVIATACPTTDARLGEWLARVADRPRDPRLSVTWSVIGTPSVRVDAAENGRPINGLIFAAEVVDAAGAALSFPLSLVAPGRYEMELPRASESRVVRLMREGNAIDAVALPGTYAAEFDRVGNDLPRLAALAERTGGRLVLASEHSPIDFRFPRRRVDLSSLVAGAAAVLVAVALIVWKRG